MRRKKIGLFGPRPVLAVIVEKGDTLSGIALREFGNAFMWPMLAGINQLPDPDLIYPGDLIVIPAPP